MVNNLNLIDIALVLEKADSFKDLENLRVQYFGKKGVIAQEFQKLGHATHEERKQLGEKLNTFKDSLSKIIRDKHLLLKNSETFNKLQSEYIDITLPCRNRAQGTIHPLSKALADMIQIFMNMGFDLKEGPEIDDDFHNFTALNIPEHHPARDMHDTFYMKSIFKTLQNKEPTANLLRTHTSNVQVRAMTKSSPPFKFITTGRVYRCDSDATHSPMFHQIEGVHVDKKIDMGHLKGCIKQFIDAFFEDQNIEMRLRPSFFPFTEPSAEVDISIKGSKWLEVLGCGMIHPSVLRNVGIDPKEYQGFAFGLGLDRFTMLKSQIHDLRTFFEGDIRWSKKYGANFAL